MAYSGTKYSTNNSPSRTKPIAAAKIPTTPMPNYCSKQRHDSPKPLIKPRAITPVELQKASACLSFITQYLVPAFEKQSLAHPILPLSGQFQVAQGDADSLQYSVVATLP